MSKRNYLNGISAEEIAERLYLEKGYHLMAKRWRSPAGEIDLIFQAGDLIVFTEVKARRTHEAAVRSISHHQWARIAQSAEIFVSELGRAVETDLRFDAALVDRSGECVLIENAPEF